MQTGPSTIKGIFDAIRIFSVPIYQRAPKEHGHIHEATIADFCQLKLVFTGYDDFVNELMDGFFLGTTIKVDWGSRG